MSDHGRQLAAQLGLFVGRCCMLLLAVWEWIYRDFYRVDHVDIHSELPTQLLLEDAHEGLELKLDPKGRSLGVNLPAPKTVKSQGQPTSLPSFIVLCVHCSARVEEIKKENGGWEGWVEFCSRFGGCRVGAWIGRVAGWIPHACARRRAVLDRPQQIDFAETTAAPAQAYGYCRLARGLCGASSRRAGEGLLAAVKFF